MVSVLPATIVLARLSSPLPLRRIPPCENVAEFPVIVELDMEAYANSSLIAPTLSVAWLPEMVLFRMIRFHPIL